MNSQFSRRQFVLLAGAGLCVTNQAIARSAELTARQVIERIQKQVGVPWRAETVDTFKIGDPETVVKGIATSFSGTLDVCQRMVVSGKNLLIVHEPTFYNHTDDTKDLTSEVYKAKRDFIEKNNVVIWRFHDHWHARRPDGVFVGMTDALGWGKYLSVDNPRRFDLPGTSLEGLAKDIQHQLKIRAMRVIGDPQMKISRVVLSPGFNNPQGMMRALDRPDVDVLIIGESREWEAVEYLRDVITTGRKKALIVLGHVPSEEAGMSECAKWLKTFISEVPIEYLPGGEPFWSPK
jgi:putative NIF3 family GTP cyclohydrolase 1 type 2